MLLLIIAIGIFIVIWDNKSSKDRQNDTFCHILQDNMSTVKESRENYGDKTDASHDKECYKSSWRR